MAANKPIELYFVQPIYARGEHIIGKNAIDESGKVNMIRVERGEKHQVVFEAARDLIIAKQAIDFRNSSPEAREDAKEYVAKCLEAQKPNKKAA